MNIINNGFIFEEIWIFILYIINCWFFYFSLYWYFLRYVIENIKSILSVFFRFCYFIGLCRNNGIGWVWSFYLEFNNIYGYNVIW